MGQIRRLATKTPGRSFAASLVEHKALFSLEKIWRLLPWIQVQYMTGVLQCRKPDHMDGIVYANWEEASFGAPLIQYLVTLPLRPSAVSFVVAICCISESFWRRSSIYLVFSASAL